MNWPVLASRAIMSVVIRSTDALKSGRSWAATPAASTRGRTAVSTCGRLDEGRRHLAARSLLRGGEPLAPREHLFDLIQAALDLAVFGIDFERLLQGDDGALVVAAALGDRLLHERVHRLREELHVQVGERNRHLGTRVRKPARDAQQRFLAEVVAAAAEVLRAQLAILLHGRVGPLADTGHDQD